MAPVSTSTVPPVAFMRYPFPRGACVVPAPRGGRTTPGVPTSTRGTPSVCSPSSGARSLPPVPRRGDHAGCFPVLTLYGLPVALTSGARRARALTSGACCFGVLPAPARMTATAHPFRRSRSGRTTPRAPVAVMVATWRCAVSAPACVCCSGAPSSAGRVCSPVALTPGAWHTPTTHGRAHHRGVRGTSGARLQDSPSTHPVHSCVRVQGRALFRLPRGRSSVPPRARVLFWRSPGLLIPGAGAHFHHSRGHYRGRNGSPVPGATGVAHYYPWRVLFRRTVARLQDVALPGALTHARACVAGARLQGVTRGCYSRRVLTCNGSRGGRVTLPAHHRAGA